MARDWDFDLARAAVLPSETVVLFGAQVGWSPHREAQKLGHCRECGSQLPDLDLAVVVCGGCRKSNFDDTRALARAGAPVARAERQPADRRDARRRTEEAVARPVAPSKGTIEVPADLAAKYGLGDGA
jgi:hypothetical protein